MHGSLYEHPSDNAYKIQQFNVSIVEMNNFKQVKRIFYSACVRNEWAFIT